MAIEKALLAGVDILLIADNAPDTAARAIAIIRQLVADGRISPERIARSLRRIQQLKSRLNTLAQPGRQPPCPSSTSSAAAVSAKPSAVSGRRTAP
jgi:beta-N-acetylhexosaminidase